MTAPAVRLCQTCRQPWPVPDLCTCNHSRIMHRFGNSETASTGTRGSCSEFARPGPCPCRKYTPREETP